MAQTPYAELHCHTNFSFLDGASPPDDLVERAVELGLTGLAVTDHDGLYGAVRFVSAAEAAGLHPVVGLEIELLDPAVPDPDRVVLRPPAGRRGRRASAGDRQAGGARRRRGLPGPSTPGAGPAPRSSRAGQGGPARHRRADARAASRPAGPLAGRLAEPLPARLAGQPGRDQGRARASARRCSPSTRRAWWRCRVVGEGELARRLRAGDRAGARAVAERYATLFGRGDGPATSRLLRRAVAPPAARRRLARGGVGGARRGARAAGRGHQRRPLRPPEDRELADVLTAIRHGRSLDTLGDLRRPDGESYLKSGDEMAALPPGDHAAATGDPRAARAWAEGIDDGGRARGVVLDRSRLRAVPLPGLPGPRRGDAVLVPVGAVLGGRPEALPPADLGGRQAARPRARGHRASRPRRVLPDLLGPDALREGAEDPGAGPGQRDQLDRVVHPRDQPGRARSPTTSCSSGSSTRAGRPTRTSTSTSARSGARRSSSTSTGATARSTRGWSATSSRTGRGRRCARWATRWGSRGRSSIGSRRRSRPTTA